ncbi:MAG: hypothetical protein WDM76_14940 [Limisphaerales bacterium]
MLYPFIFHPIFKERVWGGRELERLYGKKLPPNKIIGESWEISDRPNDESVIANGPLAGKTLRWLMKNHGAELLGDAKSTSENRFPLLIKFSTRTKSFRCKFIRRRAKLRNFMVNPKPKCGSLPMPNRAQNFMWV